MAVAGERGKWERGKWERGKWERGKWERGKWEQGKWEQGERDGGHASACSADSGVFHRPGAASVASRDGAVEGGFSEG